jgi:hypothetical protein
VDDKKLADCETVVEALDWLLSRWDTIFITVHEGKGIPGVERPLSAVKDQQAVYKFVQKYLRGWWNARNPE